MSISKNGIISTGGFSDHSLAQDMGIKVLDDGSVWARIHWLDVGTTIEWFTNKAEVLKCTDKSNRYSLMGIVDGFKTSDGIYEFMLTYPSLSSTLYNRWTQTSSPNDTTVSGFTAIVTAWNGHNKGIRLHQTSTSIYDCDSGSTWYTPIGQLASWTSTQYIPSANGSSQTSTELWVRTDTLPQQQQVKIFQNYITAKDFIEL